MRLSDEELKALMERLSAEDEASHNRRRTERYDFRVRTCIIHFQTPGLSQPAAYVAPTRNISSGGMSFLHGGFVYPGTRCVVQIISKKGSWKHIEAKVVRCVFVSGTIHEVGVAFATEIEPSEFCSDAVKTDVLLVEDDPLMVKVAKVFLTQLKAQVDHCEKGEEAVKLAMEKGYDAVLMDIELPGMSGLDAVRELRSKGYTGYIVALTGLTEPSDRDECLKAGCDRYIPKPYDRETIASLIESLKKEPLVSAYSRDPAMGEVIREFVESLPAKLRRMEEAIQTNDRAALQKACREMKAESGIYGFAPISNAAAKVEKALIEKCADAELRTLAEGLVRLGYQARAAQKKTPPPNVRPVETPPADTPPADGAAPSNPAPVPAEEHH